MHISDDQFKEDLLRFVRENVKEIVAHREENAQTAQTARKVWQALLDAPIWTIAPAKKPNDPSWREPEEIWTEHVEVTKK